VPGEDTASTILRMVHKRYGRTHLFFAQRAFICVSHITHINLLGFLAGIFHREFLSRMLFVYVHVTSTLNLCLSHASLSLDDASAAIHKRALLRVSACAALPLVTIVIVCEFVLLCKCLCVYVCVGARVRGCLHVCVFAASVCYCLA